MTQVVLSWFEVAVAADVGRMRKIVSMKKGSANNHGFSGIGWDEDINGACAEMAVAKALGRYWDGGIDKYKDGDVGKLQVRSSPLHNRRLIVRPDDPDGDYYVFVTGCCPQYDVRGWLIGSEAKDSRWWGTPNNRPAAYFVPVEALRSIDSLMGVATL